MAQGRLYISRESRRRKGDYISHERVGGSREIIYLTRESAVQPGRLYVSGESRWCSGDYISQERVGGAGESILKFRRVGGAGESI